jgi:hypothetical protein
MKIQIIKEYSAVLDRDMFRVLKDNFVIDSFNDIEKANEMFERLKKTKEIIIIKEEVLEE